MTITDVISVQQAKDWLNVEEDYEDAAILRLIKGAVDWVESYTCHYLYDRTISKYTRSCQTSFPEYPVKSFSVKDSSGTLLDPQPKPFYTSNRFYLTCPVQSQVSLSVGYDSIDAIPGPLIEAAYKMITYLYENRDFYSLVLPVDMQLLINPYRRSATL